MKRKIFAIMMATLMSAMMFASVATTISAEETKEKAYFYEFDAPTDVVPEDLKEKPEDQGKEDPYVDLICYDATFSNIGADTKYASFYIYNAGNIWAEAIWYTDILMDGEEVDWKTHTVDLAPSGSRWCSKIFTYEEEGSHTFQCWTDASEKFPESNEDNNFNPIPARSVWCN